MFADFQSFFPNSSEIPVFPEVPLSPHSFANGILVRSPNWLGDCVMTFPALKQLKLLLPADCALMVVCPASLQQIFQCLDCVDIVLPIRNPHAFLPKKERLHLKWTHAGYGFLFTNSFRDALILKQTGIPHLFGSSARFRSLLLTRAFPFPKRMDHILNKPHQALKYLAMAYAAGAPVWDGVMPVMTPDPLAPPCDIVQNIVSRSEPLLLVAPGAAYGSAKRLEPAKYHAAVEWWLSRGGNAVALGSGKEADAAKEVLHNLPEGRVWNLAGRTTLGELVTLMKRADFCFANDSGLMHLAAAAGVPGVAVFGSTDPAATGPLSRKWAVVYDKQDCSPCFRRECPLGTRACFSPITGDVLIRAAESVPDRI